MVKKVVATAPAETALVATPGLFDMVVLEEGKTFDDLPKPIVPYYVLADEGQFLYRDTAIGTVIVKDYKKPPLGKIGYMGGRFDWSVDRVPARIISQATDFFRKVYDKFGTEAEVIITMHNDTKEFRLFIPYQRTNGAGVKSIFEPTHIDKNYSVVGTLHSHCHFSAFHSGTDSGDAADMDGVHFTIGMLQNDPPQIVAMVAMSKKEFHFHKVDEIAELDFHADTAPDWWMNYVYPANIESEKPVGLKSLTQAQWDEFRGIKSHHVTQSTLPGVNQNNRYQPSAPYTPSGPRTPTPYPTQEQRYDWRNRPIYGDDDDPDSRWEDIRQTGGTPTYDPPKSKREERKAKKAQKRQGFEPEEDKLIGGAVFTKVNGVWVPKDIEVTQTADDMSIDLALDTAIQANIISADDWAKIRAHDYDDIEHWRLFFAAKLAITADILDTLGIEVNFSAGKKETTTEPRKGTVKKPVKGQTTIDEHTAPLEVTLEDKDGNKIPLPVVVDVTAKTDEITIRANSGKGQERTN